MLRFLPRATKEEQLYHLAKQLKEYQDKADRLTARCARLAAALEEITHGSPYSIKSRDGEYFKQIAHAALTADDANLAERWQVMEKVCAVAREWQLADERYLNDAYAEKDLSNAESDLRHAVGKLVAVAVEASK